MNSNYNSLYKKITKERNRTIIIIIILILTIVFLSYILINNIFTKPTGDENITTKLNTDSDFLNWFIDFDNLYKKEIKSPKYSLTKESFEKINNLLDENLKNNEENIYYKDNIYYLKENITIELDVNTRSFRYTKLEKDTKIEILEVRLLNGKYYVQLANKEYIYKISFNKDKIKNKKYKNNDNEVKITNSIFNNNFNW